MSLGKISSFLEKFSKLTPPDFFIRKVVSEVIKEKEKIEINIKKISLNKEGVVFLSIDNHAKNKIFIKKEELLKKVNKTLKKNIVKDFR